MKKRCFVSHDAEFKNGKEPISQKGIMKIKRENWNPEIMYKHPIDSIFFPHFFHFLKIETFLGEF